MNRTLYYRNLSLFLIVVAIIFATPYIFAQETSPTLIRVNNTQLVLRNAGNPNRVNALLGNGAVIRLPDIINENLGTVYKNDIDMVSLAEMWGNLVPEDPRLQPKEVGGKLYYPVKIMLAPNSKLNINSTSAFGYVALSDLNKPGAFSMVHFEQDKILEQEEAAALPTKENTELAESPETHPEKVFRYNPDNVYDYLDDTSPYGNTVTNGENSETTSDTVARSLRPKARPARPAETTTTTPSETISETTSSPVATPRPTGQIYAPSMDPEFNCNQSYSRNYRNTNCFKQKGYTLKEIAEHIMGDLDAINLMRTTADNADDRQPSFDPRFSLCLAYHEASESLAPNAQSVADSKGRRAWGLFQIRDTTGKDALKNHGIITPGYTGYDKASEYTTYNGDSNKGLRDIMVKELILQSDLHHSVLYMKAKKADYDMHTGAHNKACHSGLIDRFEKDSPTIDDYTCVADFYNAGRSRRSYARKITNCYKAMKDVADEKGNVTDPSRLKAALRKSKQ